MLSTGVDTQEKASRSERLEARISRAQKTFFVRAAKAQGRTLTDFLIASVQEAAERTLSVHHLLRLSEHDRKTFMTTILKPAPPGKALRQAAKRYKDRTGI